MRMIRALAAAFFFSAAAAIRLVPHNMAPALSRKCLLVALMIVLVAPEIPAAGIALARHLPALRESQGPCLAPQHPMAMVCACPASRVLAAGKSATGRRDGQCDRCCDGVPDEYVRKTR